MRLRDGASVRLVLTVPLSPLPAQLGASSCSSGSSSCDALSKWGWTDTLIRRTDGRLIGSGRPVVRRKHDDEFGVRDDHSSIEIGDC